MNFSNFLIVTDLDGTFLERGGRNIPPRNLTALARFQAGGGLFTIASGRLHTTVRSALPRPEEILNAPAILANGAYLYDYKTGRHLAEEFLAPADARDILQFVKCYCGAVPCRVSTPYTVRASGTAGLERDLLLYRPEEIEILPMDAWPLDDWYKIVFREEPAVLARVRQAADAYFGGRLTAFATGHRFLEIQKPGCTKATGIQKLQALCDGDKPRIVIACGDFENDIEMMKAADIAIAPANAIDSVKAIADYVLCDCDEGLMAEVVALIETGKMQKKV